MTKEEMDLMLTKMSPEEQNWIFHRIMWRLWPSTAGKSVILGEKVGAFREEEDEETLKEYEDMYRSAISRGHGNSKDPA